MDWRDRSLAIEGLGAAPNAAAEAISPFLPTKDNETRLVALFDRIGFGIFLLVTATLLLRPADSIPQLQNAPIYEILISACLCLSVPRLSRQFSPRSPIRPITQLIFGVWLCILLSHLVRGSLWDIGHGGIEFFKLFIYYLLIVSWVDSPKRLRQFMLCLCAYSLAQTVIGLCEYNGWINLSTLRSIEQTDLGTGSDASSVVRRLCGIGIFNDPNDLCLLLVTAMTMCFGFMRDRSLGRFWFAWFIPVTFFTYTIALTASRTGFLSLLGAVGTLLAARFGRRRALIAAAVLLPAIILAFAGRQTHLDLSDPDDTFQSRLDCWSDSLTLFRSSPVFGVGQDQQVELRQRVAHNSFIQSFAELGFAGGACFLGAFVMAIRAVYRTNVRDADPDLARLQPVVLAIVVSYAIGLLALSRNYAPATYLVLGLVAAYINLTPRARPLRLSSGFLQRLAGASVIFIVATYLFVQVMSV